MRVSTPVTEIIYDYAPAGSGFLRHPDRFATLTRQENIDSLRLITAQQNATYNKAQGLSGVSLSSPIVPLALGVGGGAYVGSKLLGGSVVGGVLGAVLGGYSMVAGMLGREYDYDNRPMTATEVACLLYTSPSPRDRS